LLPGRTLYRTGPRLQAKESRAILLTTHSTEEAEYLCDRLGIFIDGGLYCLSPPAQLKQRYGGTYVLTTAAPPGQEDVVAQLVMKMAKSAQCTHSLGGSQVFEFDTGDVTLGQVFGTMLANRERLAIRDWGIANTTLEEAFIKIAKTSSVFSDTEGLSKKGTIKPSNVAKFEARELTAATK